MAPNASLLHWGIVGTGEVSRGFAADLAEAHGARRYAVASRREHTARAFADEFGFDRAYAGIHELLADPLVDVVYIATPHATHKAIAIAAMRAGKHVLIEKPIGLNVAEVDEIASVADETGLFAMEGMWMKFSSLFRRLKDDIASGAIGDAVSVRASFGVPFPPDTGSRWSAELGGSALLDQGIYPLTMAMELFGRPVEIIARGKVRPDGVDLSEHVMLEFEGGRFAQLASSMIDFCELTATINGTGGWVNVAVPFWASASYRTHAAHEQEAFLVGSVTEIPPRGNGFIPMIDHVNGAIAGGRTQSEIHPLSATREVFTVMDEIRRQIGAAG